MLNKNVFANLQEELVNQLGRKLEVLRNEQKVLTEECRMNDELGENVQEHVTRLARPHEAAKYRLHVEEIGKITNLLLGLSSRLAKAENTLMTMPEDHVERVRLLKKKLGKIINFITANHSYREYWNQKGTNFWNN